MEDRSSFMVLGWLLLTGAPLLMGMCFAVVLRQPVSTFCAIALPWLAFLIFNIYTSQTSPDRELLQGTFPFFQLTLGSVTAVAGAVGQWVGLAFVRRRSRAAGHVV